MRHVLAAMAVLMAASIGTSAQAQKLGDQIGGMVSEKSFVMIDGFRNVTVGPRVDTINSLERQLEEQKRAIAALERKRDEQGKLLSGIERKQDGGASGVSSSDMNSLSRSVSNLERSSSSTERSLSALQRKVDDLARKVK